MKRLFIAGVLAGSLVAPAPAQDLNVAEVVVTGNRIDQDDYSDEMPAVGLRRPADFLVQQVVIRGDTRDETQRRREIYSMLDGAVKGAAASGVELSYGSYILSPLTPENFDELELQRDNRPDSERLDFLVKVRLSERMNAQQARAAVERYVDAVPEVGRAQLDSWGDSTLSMVGPDSYRSQIAAIVAEDARQMATTMGDGYAVEVEGLNMPVQWVRSGPSEVMLYIPYKLTIVPRP